MNPVYFYSLASGGKVDRQSYQLSQFLDKCLDFRHFHKNGEKLPQSLYVSIFLFIWLI